jgi:hypothetical protein
VLNPIRCDISGFSLVSRNLPNHSRSKQKPKRISLVYIKIISVHSEVSHISSHRQAIDCDARWSGLCAWHGVQHLLSGNASDYLRARSTYHLDIAPKQLFWHIPCPNDHFWFTEFDHSRDDAEDRRSQMTHSCCVSINSLFYFTRPFCGSISLEDHEINQWYYHRLYMKITIIWDWKVEWSYRLCGLICTLSISMNCGTTAERWETRLPGHEIDDAISTAPVSFIYCHTNRHRGIIPF